MVSNINADGSGGIPAPYSLARCWVAELWMRSSTATRIH